MSFARKEDLFIFHNLRMNMIIVIDILAEAFMA